MNESSQSAAPARPTVLPLTLASMVARGRCALALVVAAWALLGGQARKASAGHAAGATERRRQGPQHRHAGCRCACRTWCRRNLLHLSDARLGAASRELVGVNPKRASRLGRCRGSKAPEKKEINQPGAGGCLKRNARLFAAVLSLLCKLGSLLSAAHLRKARPKLHPATRLGLSPG